MNHDDLLSLSPRRRQVLHFLREYLSSRGFPPSIREIGTHLGVSGTRGVVKHLEALEEAGFISRSQGRSRGIVLMTKERSAVPVPVVGTVRAGLPSTAVEDVDGFVPVEREAVRGGEFFLRVRGESMIEAGILPGDLALVRPQQTAADGDLVVALIGEEATLKAFFREERGVRLQPRNASMEPILVPAGVEVVILGKVIRIVRNLA